MKHCSHRLTLEILEDRRLLATCHVVRLGDFGAGADLGGGHSRGDLRYCITKANAEPGPDTILVQVNGTINLTGPLPDLMSDIDINGPGSQLLTIQRSTGGDYRIFTVAGDTVAISGVTIKNGSADVGGGIYNQGEVFLGSVRVSANTANAGVGGGIYNAGTLSIIGGEVSANTATSHSTGFGGGLFNEAGADATIAGATFDSNQTRATCAGSTCTFNQSSGGGIYNAAGAKVSLEECTIRGNETSSGSTPTYAEGFGGGIYSAGTASIDRCTIEQNVAGLSFVNFNSLASGGGVHHASGSLTMINSTIASNSTTVAGMGSTQRGGGIFSNAGQLSIAHCTIASNRTTNPSSGFVTNQKGGGLGIEAGVVLIHDSIVANNNLSMIGAGAKEGPDIHGALSSSHYNLFGDPASGSGFDSTDLLGADPVLGPLQDNGGTTQTMALLPGSPAIDAGDPNPINPPDWDQRGPGFPRIVNGRIDIGAFEVQATGAVFAPLNLALLITADLQPTKKFR